MHHCKQQFSVWVLKQPAIISCATKRSNHLRAIVSFTDDNIAIADYEPVLINYVHRYISVIINQFHFSFVIK